MQTHLYHGDPVGLEPIAGEGEQHRRDICGGRLVRTTTAVRAAAGTSDRIPSRLVRPLVCSRLLLGQLQLELDLHCPFAVPRIAIIIGQFSIKVIVFQGKFSIISAFSIENSKEVGSCIAIRYIPPPIHDAPRLPVTDGTSNCKINGHFSI